MSSLDFSKGSLSKTRLQLGFTCNLIQGRKPTPNSSRFRRLLNSCHHQMKASQALGRRGTRTLCQLRDTWPATDVLRLTQIVPISSQATLKWNLSGTELQVRYSHLILVKRPGSRACKKRKKERKRRKKEETGSHCIAWVGCNLRVFCLSLPRDEMIHTEHHALKVPFIYLSIHLFGGSVSCSSPLASNSLCSLTFGIKFTM